MKAYPFAAVLFRFLGLWFLFGGIYRLFLNPTTDAAPTSFKHAIIDFILGLVIYLSAPLLARLAVWKIGD